MRKPDIHTAVVGAATLLGITFLLICLAIVSGLTLRKSIGKHAEATAEKIEGAIAVECGQPNGAAVARCVVSRVAQGPVWLVCSQSGCTVAGREF